MLVQSGRPVGVMRTHEWAPRVLIANSNLVGDWATWPEFRRLEHLGPDDVRPDDRRLVDLHRHPGHPAGHLRDVRGGRREAVRRDPGRHAHPHRRLRRDGRRAAARGDAERRRLPRRRRRRARLAAPGRAPLPRRGRRRPRPRGRSSRCGAKAERRRSAVGVVGNCRRRCSPSCCAAASRSTSSPTRPAPTTRCAYLPEGVDLADWRDYAERKPEEFTDRARESMARHVEAMVGFLDAGAEVFDYGNSIRDEARLGGYDRAFDFPGFVPAYIRPLFCEGKGPFRWAALSGDPKDIARHRPGRDGPVPRQRPAAEVDAWRAGRRSRSRACRRGSAGSATASGTGPGLRFNELVARGEL